jgi:group I intron endonuclease
LEELEIRRMVKYCVYKHTSPSGKVYIGITCLKPEKRFSNGRGYDKRTVFGKAIKKYGWNNFKHEILFSELTETEAKSKEKELIEQHNSTSREYGYNMSLGGDGTPGVKKSDEQRKEISRRITGKGNPFYGKKHTKETKSLISQNHADFNGENHPSYGLTRSEESRKRMSKSHADVSGENNPNWGKGNQVIQIDVNTGETIKSYRSIARAAKATGTNRISIGHCCNGRHKTANGYIWKYAEEHYEHRSG